MLSECGEEKCEIMIERSLDFENVNVAELIVFGNIFIYV